ncbi:MAG TPA: DUF937 domain-containing protein [Blastocatellia bacterium]|nr:DUF937 domain-containing protein [Blastocatellia bacterium]
MNIEGLLGQVLGGGNLGAISQTIGADENTTSTAIQAALPMLVGALARNASSEQGAASLAGALDRDHDGSVLDDIAGFVMGGGAQQANGTGILGHIFGGNQPAVEQGISQASGVDMNTVARLLPILAPIVMGYLGRQKQEQGMDAGALAGVLGQQQQQMQEQQSPLMGMLSSVLDQNRDGSMMDDALRLAGGFLNRR